MEMGKRIKELRIKKELIQEELANKLGLKKSAIAKYENGRVENIKRSTIQAMSDIFYVSPAYLMGWVDDPETTDSITQKEEDLKSEYLNYARELQELGFTDEDFEKIIKIYKTIKDK